MSNSDSIVGLVLKTRHLEQILSNKKKLDMDPLEISKWPPKNPRWPSKNMENREYLPNYKSF